MAYSIDDGIVTLTGACGIEEVEALHASLCGLHEPIFDLATAGTLHTAVVQLILASGGRVQGAPLDPLLGACLAMRPEPKETLA
jgi:hypothetical protein